jgi:hypothetical protein
MISQLRNKTLENVMDNPKFNVKEFKKDLTALMVKHNVLSMGGEYDGDSHGVYNEKFIIDVADPNNRQGKSYVIYNGCMIIDKSDLKA